MSTQQDIYASCSKTRPPMLNKDNYVAWSSHLLPYAKSRPNEKLIYNSIMNGPYVRRMIPEPGDPDREVLVEAYDQAIQTILLGLPEHIYAAVDSCMNLGQDKQMQMVGGNGGNQFRQYSGQNVGNLNGYNAPRNVGNPVVQNANGNQNGNQNGNGNVVAAQAEVRPRRRDDAYLQTQLLIAQKEEAKIQLQAEEFDLIDAAGDLDEIDVEQDGRTIQQHPTTVEETRAYFESLYNNLAIEVEKVNSVNRKIKETNADLTTDLARDNNQEKCFEINQEKYDKLKRCYQKSIYQEQCINKKINTLHLSMASLKPDSFYHIKQKMALGYQNPFYLKQAQQKQHSLYNGKFLLEKHEPPVVYDLEETLQLVEDSRLKMKQLNKEIKLANYAKINHLSGVFVSQTAKLREELYFSNTSKTDTISKSISIPNEEFSDDTSPSVARKFLNEALEFEIEHLLRVVVSQDIMSIVQNPTVVETSDLQTI
ncbi:hypothetical protein Tco_1382274 [Tanacetum coccineum]